MLVHHKQSTESDLSMSGSSSARGSLADNSLSMRLQPPSDARLMDERSVADYLGCSVALIRKWRYSGVGPPVIRLSRLVKYRRSDIDAFVENQLRPPAAA